MGYRASTLLVLYLPIAHIRFLGWHVRAMVWDRPHMHVGKHDLCCAFLAIKRQNRRDHEGICVDAWQLLFVSQPHELAAWLTQWITSSAFYRRM